MTLTEQQGRSKPLSRYSAARAVIILAALIVLGIILSAVGLMADLRQQELNSAKGQIASLSRILAEQTTRTFEGVALNMRSARDRLSDDTGQHFGLDSFPVHLLLKARTNGQPQVKSLFVVDKDGHVVNSSRPDFPRNLSVLDRSFFRHFAIDNNDEMFIGTPEKARVDGQWTYYAAIRLVDGKGGFRGVLAAAVSIDHFESFYQRIGVDFGSRVQLLNEEGYLLAGRPHDENAVGKQVASAAVRARLRDKPPGLVVETEEATPDGLLFAAYRNVAGYPLAISVAVKENDALVSWRRIAQPIAIGVGGGVLFILAATLVIARNLLRRDALETALKESDARLRHMVQSVQDAIIIVDSARHIVTFNRSAERLFGVLATEAVGSKISDLLSRQLDLPQRRALLRHLEEGWRSASGQTEIELIELFRNGEPYPVELSLSTTVFRGEMLLTAIFRDLSERRRAECELLESNRQLQRLSAAMENVREEERSRISREMHDELGQFLTGIRMELSWLGRRLSAKQDELADKVGDVKGQIDQTIAAVRRISSELRPLVLDDLGFAAAAAWYVDQFTGRTGLSVTLTLPEDELPQGSPVATALFRLLQESLTNVARHAQASHVIIQLSRTNGYWRLAIQDDGRGFDPAKKRRSGIGLIGMRERVQILHGNLSIVTAPGGGTLVEASVPEDHKTEEQNAQNRGFAGR